MDRQFSHKTLQSTEFDRYIIVKGKNLQSVEQKLREWGELPAPGNVYTYQFFKAQLDEWTIIKLPEELMTDHYNYHNMVYWFLGFPPEDNNYADQSIGLSIDRNGQKTYLIYNDYQLRQKLSLEDDMFGIFQNNEKFILSIPFDEFKVTGNEEIKEFQSFINNYNIDVETIQSGNLNYSDFGVVFNEK